MTRRIAKPVPISPIPTPTIGHRSRPVNGSVPEGSDFFDPVVPDVAAVAVVVVVVPLDEEGVDVVLDVGAGDGVEVTLDAGVVVVAGVVAGAGAAVLVGGGCVAELEECDPDPASGSMYC